jgi:hypothetical protein
MTAIVAVETVLLVLLVVLVAGLLRSHAEILRRLEEERSSPPGPPPPRSGSRETLDAPDLAGTTLDGDALKLTFETGAPMLLAFLTTGCSTCAAFWESLGERRVAGVQTVIVTRGPEREQPAKLRALAPDGVPVVMSSQAWEDYEVPGAPYFVLVDGGVAGEGVATTWKALSSLVADARADVGVGTKRAREVDDVLAAGGIGPNHPSLYPGRNGG